MTNHQFWDDVEKELNNETDLTNFKNWSLVRQIPLYTDNELFDDYAFDVATLATPEWDSVIRNQESKLGHSHWSYEKAIKQWDYGTTTAFRLKALHHALTFEEMRERSITDYDLIIDFGAGIGELAHV